MRRRFVPTGPILFCPPGKPYGMTLVEILMALVIISVVTGGIFTFYNSEQRAYQRQYQAQQRDQQLRFATNSMVQELLEAGYSAAGRGLVHHLSEWVPGVFIPGSPLEVRLDANPKITLGDGNSPDMITFLSVLPTDTGAARLAKPSSDTLIVPDLSKSEIKEQFKPGDLLCLGEGETYARVSAVNGEILTIDTDPSVPGNQPLTDIYPPGTVVAEISVVTYAVFNRQNDPEYKRHAVGVPELKRQVNAGGFQPVAENISDMQLSLEEDGRLKIVLTALLNPLSPGKADEAERGEKEATSLVLLRNSRDIGIGSQCPCPAAPANFTVRSALDARSPCRILVAWDPVSRDISGALFKSDACAVSGYRIYYDIAAKTLGNHIDVAACPEEGLAIEVKMLPADTYYVRVAAINGGGPGEKSPEVAIQDLEAPSRPEGLRAYLNPEGTVSLAWEEASDCDLAGYRVFRKTGIGGEVSLLSGGLIPGGTSGFIDAYPPPGETCRYAVRSEDHGFNLSPFSETVSVEIPGTPAREVK